MFLHRFREYMSQVFPYISAAALLENQVQNTTHPKSARALRDIICAHAASTMTNSDPEYFYRKALGFLDEKTVRGSSIELIQTLLLLASFQQNNQRSVASWTSHSLAVKAAYQIGLHVPSSYADHTETECEIKRRLWHAVINQDR